MRYCWISKNQGLLSAFISVILRHLWLGRFDLSRIRGFMGILEGPSHTDAREARASTIWLWFLGRWMNFHFWKDKVRFCRSLRYGLKCCSFSSHSSVA